MSAHEINTQQFKPEILRSPADAFELVEVEESKLGAVALLYAKQAETIYDEAVDDGIFHGLALDLSTVSGIDRPEYGSGITEIMTITPPTNTSDVDGNRSVTTMLRHTKSHGPLEVSDFKRDEAGRWQHIRTVGIDGDAGLSIKKGSGIVYGVVKDSIDWRSKDARSYGDTPRLQTLLELIKLSNESPLRETPDSVRRLPRRSIVGWLMSRRDS